MLLRPASRGDPTNALKVQIPASGIATGTASSLGRGPGSQVENWIMEQGRHEKTGVGGRIAKMPFPKLRSLKTRDAYFAPHEFEEALNFLLKVVWLRENVLYCIQLEISWVCYHNFQLHLRERRFNEVFSVPSVVT